MEVKTADAGYLSQAWTFSRKAMDLSKREKPFFENAIRRLNTAMDEFLMSASLFLSGNGFSERAMAFSTRDFSRGDAGDAEKEGPSRDSAPSAWCKVTRKSVLSRHFAVLQVLPRPNVKTTSVRRSGTRVGSSRWQNAATAVISSGNSPRSFSGSCASMSWRRPAG